MDGDEYEQSACFASLPRTTRGLPLVITGSPDGSKLVYCNGNSVIIRSVKKPSDCEIYTEHATLTTMGRFSPSSFYIASGDQTGKVRIWDTTQSTHILKAEYPVIAGPVRDIAWSDDSKRLAVVGEGRERFGHVFLFDTGTSNGSLSGQSRSVSSVDCRPCRPYRLVTGSEDNTVAIFEGPPFKFKTAFHEHSRFVHCVRYRPDGSLFASAGADGKVILFDGNEGEVQGKLVDSNCKVEDVAHNGGVFSLCWSPDGQKILTASGDKTCKIWNVETRELETTFNFGSAIEDQQLGCIWLEDGILSVSLAGFIFSLDPENPDKPPTRVIKGHNKPITALAVSPDRNFLFTGDFEGNITRWDAQTGDSERVNPMVHKSQNSGLSVSENGLLASVGWDDTIAFTESIFDSIQNVQPTVKKLTSQPRGVCMSADGQMTAVACQKSLLVFVNQSQNVQIPINYESVCIDLHPEKKLLAVGGQDNKVHIYDIGSSEASELKTLTQNGAITSVAWSPDGKLLVASDSGRRVVPYRVDEDFALASKKDWTFHSARVNCVAWSDNSRYVVSGGLDTNLIVWDMQMTGEHPVIIKGAHTMSAINGVAWLGPNKIVSVGQDSNVKQWTVKL